MNKENQNNVKEIKNISFKILFKDGLFNIGFADRDTLFNKVNVLWELNLNEEQFKAYFFHMLQAVVAYKEDTGNDILVDLMNEFKE